ncbi:hypothetical protein [Cellulomonas persica]|uniref:Htaa domain-containing protein n=1 Tax=Cellulomonas persica TaxID=76861 RepID=A0A510UTC0_9CELL|nr:hypothetical protein [Cellulomonas persica]GEK17934.1 hypothetical protein CPE01_16670 [Cellulomonas persica]
MTAGSGRATRVVVGRALTAGALALGAVALPATVPTHLPASSAAADDDVVIDVTIPEPEAVAVTDAQLRWGLNREVGGGAFYGGCNFLSAGKAGSTGGSRPWTAQDGLYAARAGDVRIEKPGADGTPVLASWDTRCLDASGEPVSVGSVESTSGNQVVVEGGAGSVDLTAGTASVRWTGSFTAVLYGGMTYWTASDPVLEVADGTGTLTATLSGFGADRDEPGRWVALTPRTATLAVLTDVEITQDGLVVVPEFRGVAVKAPAGAAPQVARDTDSEPYWGSFPQDFVDFQGEVGQAPYWYTSGSARDRAKPATALVVSLDASRPVTPPADDDDQTGGGTPSPGATPQQPRNEVKNRPATTRTGPVRPTTTSADGDLAAVAPQIPTGSGAQALVAQPAAPAPAAGGGVLAGLADDPLALGALGAIGLAAAAGVVGLRQGWVVLPWVR